MKFLVRKSFVTISLALILPIILSVLAFAATDSSNISSNLVLYYSFDEANVTDLSGNNNNAALYGSTPPLLDKNNKVSSNSV